LGLAHRELKSKAPLLAKNARNGAPSPVEGPFTNGGVGHPPRALTVREVGALSDLDNITVRIADVAARLAVLRDRFQSLRAQPDGKVLVTDGPYTGTKEHMGGFWILEAADLDEALAWARKGAVACHASGEVRELLFSPDPKGASK
jgi:hypothetical protein